MRVIKRSFAAAMIATFVGMTGAAAAPTAAATYYGYCQTATRTFYYYQDSSLRVQTNQLTETVIGCWNGSVSGFKYISGSTYELISFTNGSTVPKLTRFDRNSTYADIHQEHEWAYGSYHFHANTEMRVYKSGGSSTTWGEWNYCYRLEDRNTWASCGYTVSGVSLSAPVQQYFSLVF